MTNTTDQLFPFTYSHFSESAIVHGVCSRHGGMSPSPWRSLNVSHGVGDSASNVEVNRQRIKNDLGIKQLLSAKQVHGDAVHVQDTPLKADLEVDGFDSLITNKADVGLMIQQADCQAVMLYDPVQQVIANIHAGWRGSVQNIIGKTIEALTKRFSCRANNLLAAVSPSLGPCCAEFIHYQEELPPAFHHYQTKDKYFDFWAITGKQLCDCGVLTKNIQIAKICTVCNQDYFSYRRDGSTGRFASVIALRTPADGAPE